MDLQELQKNWNELGKTDPLWAILTDPSCRGGKWDVERFFATGREEIAEVMQQADALHLPEHRGTALDFGCGVGRLTQALCGWFDRCYGVDIAPSMIDLARQYNRAGLKCEYFVNPHPDLRLFPDDQFDLVHSNIVLQHMRPEYSALYIREFVRVVRPGGLVIFQIPEGKRPSATPLAPLPDSAFRAGFSGFPLSVEAAAQSRIDVPVTVRNLGDCKWPSKGDTERKYAVRLGNHWLTPNGVKAIWDDGRQSLPADLEPGAEVRMNLTVTAPNAPGKYVLELDMLQEAVAWFNQKSSTAVRIPAEIEPAAPTAQEFTPYMEMYGLSRDVVVGIQSSAGARVVDVRPDGFAGSDWISFKYFATKP